MKQLLQWLCLSLSVVAAACSSTILPPLPILPLPTAQQLAWQRRERIMFLHFGMYTFVRNLSEAGPEKFNPSGLDAGQWVRVAKEGGFRLIILTVKHNDGFCLWPSAYTSYSVQASPWKGGQGDVVREFTEAAGREGIAVGLYLSPWDRHESSYGDNRTYNEYYLAQLYELLTNYGDIAEIWFDGDKGSDAPSMEYLFKTWFGFTHELQSAVNIFSDAGPDVRWVGNEDGAAGSTCWSMMNKSSIQIGAGNNLKLLNMGDRYGEDWVPPECDVSTRNGWFWWVEQKVKTLGEVLRAYYDSVGRNCVLLLNVPPNSTGVIPDEDVALVAQFHQSLQSIFAHNLASGARATAGSIRGRPFAAANVLDEDTSTYWAPAEENDILESGVEEKGIDEGNEQSATLKLHLRNQTDFNVVMIQEAIGWGQRVAKYSVRWRRHEEENWSLFSNGTTIGYKKLDKFSRCSTGTPPSSCLVKGATEVELVIEESRAPPLIATLGLYLDQISPF